MHMYLKSPVTVYKFNEVVKCFLVMQSVFDWLVGLSILLLNWCNKAIVILRKEGRHTQHIYGYMA